jgi:hypothetical protein
MRWGDEGEVAVGFFSALTPWGGLRKFYLDSFRKIFYKQCLFWIMNGSLKFAVGWVARGKIIHPTKTNSKKSIDRTSKNNVNYFFVLKMRSGRFEGPPLWSDSAARRV